MPVEIKRKENVWRVMGTHDGGNFETIATVLSEEAALAAVEKAVTDGGWLMAVAHAQGSIVGRVVQ